MKTTIVVIAMALASSAAQAEDLLCNGTANTPGEIQATDSRVLSVNFETLEASISTFNGPAAGVLKKSAKDYVGLVTAENRVLYSLTLDRYSGEIFLGVVSKESSSKSNYQVEFFGSCSKQIPKF